jgi:hypothetical protein
MIGARALCMQKAFELMEWILLSTHAADCTDQTPSSADGTSSTLPRAPQSFLLLELPLHSSHGVPMATKTGSPCFSRCGTSHLSALGQTHGSLESS